jgi:hypothetical protein
VIEEEDREYPPWVGSRAGGSFAVLLWVLRCAQDDNFVGKKQIPLRGMTERKAKTTAKADSLRD